MTEQTAEQIQHHTDTVLDGVRRMLRQLAHAYADPPTPGNQKHQGHLLEIAALRFTRELLVHAHNSTNKGVHADPAFVKVLEILDYYISVWPK